jgi:hypothetical protein
MEGIRHALSRDIAVDPPGAAASRELHNRSNQKSLQMMFRDGFNLFE